MDQLRLQILNYLDWLESRGLTGAVSTSHRPIAAYSEGDNSSAFDANGAAKITQADRETGLSSAIGASGQSLALENPPSEPSENAAVLPAGPRTTAGSTFRLPSGPSSNAIRRIGFYSSSDLTEQEHIMVSRIALALGLPADDFRIWAEDSLVRIPDDLLRCSYIVALGPGSGQTLLALGQTVTMNTIQRALQGSPLLTIPHPRAMLKEPKLKAGAWVALQNFKTLMQPKN